MLKFDATSRKAVKEFGLVLAIFIVLESLLGAVQFPLVILPEVEIIVTILFAFFPMIAIYRVAKASWSPMFGAVALVVGVTILLGMQVPIPSLAHSPIVALRFFAAVLSSISQAGLIIACVALGSLIATLIKEKNLILPIAIFLAALDVFLVLTPVGFTKKEIQSHPEVFRHVAYQVPRVVEHAHVGPAAPMVFIGPADILFLAMFFIALFRFHMRADATFKAVVPTLLAYLGIVLFFGGVHIGSISLAALPALLPIGTVVTLVNWREFKFTGEEKLSVAVVVLLGLGLVVFGATRKPDPLPLPTPPPGPSQTGPSPNAPKPAAKP